MTWTYLRGPSCSRKRPGASQWSRCRIPGRIEQHWANEGVKQYMLLYANIWGILMVNVTIYSIHGSYGLCFSDWCKQKTPSLVLRLSGHMEWRSGHVWTKFHIVWWKAVLGHGYALRLCQQWRQREGLTAFDSWNPGFSRVLTSSERQRYLYKAACKYVMLKCFSIPHTVFLFKDW